MIFDGVEGGGMGVPGKEMSNVLELRGESMYEAGGKGLLIIEQGFFGRQIWKDVRKESLSLGVLGLAISDLEFSRNQIYFLMLLIT